MLWKEQGVTVLAISAVYDIFVFHRLKMHQIISALYKVSLLCGKLFVRHHSLLNR